MSRNLDLKSVLSKSTTLSTLSLFLTRNKSVAVDKDQLAFIDCPIVIKASDHSLSHLNDYKLSTSSIISSATSDRKTNGDITNNIKEFFKTECNYVAKLNKVCVVIELCLSKYTVFDSGLDGKEDTTTISPHIKTKVNLWKNILKNLKEIQKVHQASMEKHEATLRGIESFINEINEAMGAYKRFFNNALQIKDPFMHSNLKNIQTHIDMNEMYFDELMTEPYTRLMRYPLMLKSMVSVVNETESGVLESMINVAVGYAKKCEEGYSKTEDYTEFLKLTILIRECPLEVKKGTNEILGIFPVFKVPLIDNKLSVSLEEYKTSHTVVILKSGLLMLDCRVKESFISNVKQGIELLLKKRSLKACGYIRYDECELKFNNDYRLMTIFNPVSYQIDYFQFQTNFIAEFKQIQKGFFEVMKFKYDVQGLDYFDNIYTCYTLNRKAPGNIYYTQETIDKAGIIITKVEENIFVIYKNGNRDSGKEGKLSRLPEVLRANCNLSVPLPSPKLKRNSTIGNTMFKTIRFKTLKRQTQYPDLTEIEQLDQKYVITLMRLVVKHYKDTDIQYNSDKVHQILLRINKKQNENVLLKDVESQDLMEAVKQFIIDHPELKIVENDSQFPNFVHISRELWQILSPAIFESFITAFWSVPIADIKVTMKKGGLGPRNDSRYLQ